MKYQKTALRLKDLMAKKGLTAQELADKSGVGKSSISHYVNGSNEPHSINAGKLAKVLDCSPLYIMGFDEKEPKIAGTSIPIKTATVKVFKFLIFFKFFQILSNLVKSRHFGVFAFCCFH